MAEFSPITTQEELNNVIGERILKAKESAAKEFQLQIAAKDDEIKQFRAQLEETNNLLNAANERISGFAQLEEEAKGYKKEHLQYQVAVKMEIPFRSAHRIKGETEEEMMQDAEDLRRELGIGAPSKNTESANIGGEVNETDAALRNLLSQVRK